MVINATSSPLSASDEGVDSDLLRELAQLIVTALNLEMDAASIDPQQPLYADGLGLDSVDILEIALVVSKRFGFQLRSDSAENQTIFSSLQSLARYISVHRTL